MRPYLVVKMPVCELLLGECAKSAGTTYAEADVCVIKLDRAHCARGDRAVEVATSRRTLLIGSERPEALCAAIGAARREEGGQP